jgi:hypothetical protein
MNRKPARFPSASRHRMFEKSKDNAIEKILELFEAGTLAFGNFTEIVISHEEDCQRLEKRGPCNCDPKIQIVRPWMVPRKVQ